MYQMTGFTADTSGRTIIIIGLVQGFGMGFVFIPLSTVAFLTLPPRYRTDGTSMLTLVRNVASSAGISVVIANLTNMTTTFRSQLVEHISPFNDALQHPDVSRWMDLATDQGRALAESRHPLRSPAPSIPRWNPGREWLQFLVQRCSLTARLLVCTICTVCVQCAHSGRNTVRGLTYPSDPASRSGQRVCEHGIVRN
jgi:hypothetical protein